MRYGVRIMRALVAAITLAMLCACAGGGSTGALATTPLGGPSNSVQGGIERVTLSARPTSAVLPAVGGITGTMVFGPVASPGIVAVTASSSAPSGVSALQSRRTQSTSGSLTVLEYVAITPVTTIALESLPAISLTLPASNALVGKTFYYGISNPVDWSSEAETNPLAPSGLVTFDTEGPARANGQTVSFPAVPKPLVLVQGHTYAFIVYDVVATLHAAAKIYLLDASGSITTYGADGSRSVPTILNTGGFGFTIDRTGKFYVAIQTGCNSKNCIPGSVAIFNPDGSPSTPTITAGLVAPTAVAVDARGRIYVANEETVNTYLSDGTPSFYLLQAINLPIDVAVDPAGNIHVLNSGNNTVTTYRSDGTQIPPTINTGLQNVTKLAIDAAGKVYVIGWNTELRIFSAEGKPSIPSFSELDFLSAVAVDAAGKIYIGNSGSSLPVFTAYNADGTAAPPTIEMNAGAFIRDIVVR